MRRLIDPDSDHDYLLDGRYWIESAQSVIEDLSSAQPEQRVEELLPDGTLHLFTDTDLSKVNRVLVSQNNTHYGDLYYADEDPKRGKWIPCSERLPEECGNYLISIDGEEPDIGTINPNDPRGWSLCDANGFYWASDKALNITAWMPLPEPYTERREE